MSATSGRRLILSAVLPILLASCANPAPTAPSDERAAEAQFPPLQRTSNPVARPIKGDCTTTFTFIDPGQAGACAVFQQVPSAFIAIGGRCQVSHLGRTALSSVQQLVFQLDASGQPVLVDGQPVIVALRNCSTLTAANGDELLHTTIGDVMPAGPAEAAFAGSMTFVDGTGRFSGVSGSATFKGTASLARNTGAFSFEGRVVH
jgi:hypothetical protein